jgi:hypothetical protein
MDLRVNSRRRCKEAPGRLLLLGGSWYQWQGRLRPFLRDTSPGVYAGVNCQPQFGEARSRAFSLVGLLAIRAREAADVSQLLQRNKSPSGVAHQE